MTFNKKDPGETLLYMFDFVQLLKSEETIDSAFMTISVIEGADPNANDMLLGLVLIDGTVAAQMVTAGIDGNIYSLKCYANTSLNQTLILYNDLPVKTFI